MDYNYCGITVWLQMIRLFGLVVSGSIIVPPEWLFYVSCLCLHSLIIVFIFKNHFPTRSHLTKPQELHGATALKTSRSHPFTSSHGLLVTEGSFVFFIWMPSFGVFPKDHLPHEQ